MRLSVIMAVLLTMVLACQAPVNDTTSPRRSHPTDAASAGGDPSGSNSASDHDISPGDTETPSCTATSCDNVYTECTCSAQDPCGWKNDGVCDSACAQHFPSNHFVDTADCGDSPPLPADLADCVDAAVATCRQDACAAEYSALGSCYSSCGVFAEAWCIDDYCGPQVFAVVTCMLNDCAQLAACGTPCEVGCAGLAACGNTTLDDCVDSCGPLSPSDTLLMTCGASIACGELAVCTSLETGCYGDTWACADGTCIASDAVCDGSAQCNNQSDETGVCEQAACPLGKRLCDGTCVACPAHASNTECDGAACVATQCDSNYDLCGDACCEFSGGCYSYEFACADGSCIADNKECDNIAHCADGSDEHTQCPAIAPLFDPNRLSLAQECGGQTMSEAQLLALFDPGTNRLSFGSTNNGARINFSATSYTRTCTQLTECGTWAESVSPKDIAVTTDKSGNLSISINSYTSRPVTDSADVVFLNTSGPARRVRFAYTTTGLPCLQTTDAYRNDAGDSGTTYESYSVGSGTFRTALAGTALASPPSQPSDSYRCLATPATTQQIASAWFDAGTTYESITDRSRVGIGKSRTCFAPTGCTQWNEYTLSDANRPNSLSISNNQIYLSAYSRSLVISNGTFSAALDAIYGGAEGHVGTTCLEYRRVYDVTSTATIPSLQQFTWERVANP